MGTSESHKLNEKGLRNTLRKFCENRFWDRGWQRTEKKQKGHRQGLLNILVYLIIMIILSHKMNMQSFYHKKQ